MLMQDPKSISRIKITILTLKISFSTTNCTLSGDRHTLSSHAFVVLYPPTHSLASVAISFDEQTDVPIPAYQTAWANWPVSHHHRAVFSHLIHENLNFKSIKWILTLFKIWNCDPHPYLVWRAFRGRMERISPPLAAKEPPSLVAWF